MRARSRCGRSRPLLRLKFLQLRRHLPPSRAACSAALPAFPKGPDHAKVLHIFIIRRRIRCRMPPAMIDVPKRLILRDRVVSLILLTEGAPSDDSGGFAFVEFEPHTQTPSNWTYSAKIIHATPASPAASAPATAGTASPIHSPCAAEKVSACESPGGSAW